MTTVFIGCDYILDPWLLAIQRQLEAQGMAVVRGPAQVPPKITEIAPHDWPHYFGAAEIIVTSTRTRIPAEALDAAPRLRGVVFPTIGTESIDLEAAQARGVVVAHGPTPENFLSMAESTVMLMTALFYDLHGTEAVLRENRPRPRVLAARMMLGKTIGLIGMGRIARAVVERLQGWGVHILASDPFVAQPQAPAGVEMVALPTLLARSDLVSIHTTLNPQTRHLVGAPELAAMKPGAFLVNTARGGMIDDDALVAALRSGHLGGAALDAFNQEPLPADHAYRSLPHVILTPHMVGHTQEIFDAIPPAALRNIDHILRGEPPPYTRNPEVLPAWRERLSVLQR